MKIRITSHGVTTTAELNDSSTIGEVVEVIKGLLIAQGFHYELVNEHLKGE